MLSNQHYLTTVNILTKSTKEVLAKPIEIKLLKQHKKM